MNIDTAQDELLNEHIANLSPAKRALLELKLRKKAAKATDRISIPHRSRHSPAPLSFGQQRIWFLSQLEPDSSAYNLPFARHISGELDVAGLEWAFGEIVRRHESLRTRFESEGGVPRQVIDAPREWRLKLVDLSDKEPAQRVAEAEQLAWEERQRPFVLDQDWGMRVQLLRLSNREHILLLTLHHIVSDGWSMGNLFGELQRLYEAHERGEASPLTQLGLQYADYAVWQRELLGAAELQKQLSYWKEQLAGVRSVDLLRDKSRPVTPSYLGEKQSLRLSQELSQQLHSLARAEGATLFMVLLAAFQVLLSRYSGQPDISVGTPIANRNRAELEELIGFFVNTLVLRTDLSGDPSFAQLVQRVREVALAAYAHQDLPFEKLVEELQPERSLSRNPLFDVLFAVQNAPRSEGQLGELRLEPWGQGSNRTRVDLELHVRETPEGLVCTFVYASDLFSSEMIHRLMGHYQQLLEAVAMDAGQRLSELPLLTNAEREQLHQWNDTSRAYPEQCIQELFEAQVQQQGTAIAVRCGGEELSYAELNERANQLAHYLKQRGVRPEVMVGLCVKRSLEMIVGMLGVLKAGGAYVPLDPAYPEERLRFMLEDTKARLLLTQEPLLPQLPETSAEIVCLDSDWEEISKEKNTNLSGGAAPANLAYVIYTSGSTGKPKGVAIEHRSGTALLAWALDVFTPQELSGMLASTSICFDLSFFELFVPLSSGGKVIVVDHVLQLLTLPASQDVKLVNTVPSAMVELLRLGGLPESVETVSLAGEALSPSLVDQLYERPHIKRVYDLYGPSEDTTYSTYELRVPAGRTTIGRPISNTQTYVLDPAGEPVPIGVPGELYLGGAGLARAYLQRPELTAEVFLPDPFSGRRGARLYKTGDMARYLEDGSLEYLGRIDHQVKLRGFRIELGEIESALSENPAVQQAAVVVREEINGNKRLVAYVVLQPNKVHRTTELRTHLQQTVPDYMIPSAFVVLDKFPVTTSGKVDRSRLPAPAEERPELAEAFVRPRTQIEQELARIWELVLKVKGVGVHDNFFRLGGHSLLATQVISQVNGVLHVEMPLRALFESPTIAEFAQVVEHKGSIGELSVWPTVMKIQPLGTRRPIFFVAAPDINALGYVKLADHLGEDQPLYALQSQKYHKTLTDEYGRPLLEFSQAVVEELASEYVRAMREVQPHGPYSLGGMCRGAHIVFEMAAQLKAQGETVSFLGILDTWVMENTYSYLFYVEYYCERARWFLKLGARAKFKFVTDKIGRSLNNVMVRLRLREAHGGAALPPVTAVYWPDSSFVPHIYDGPITVFRVSNQPATRIRSHTLGWEERTTGGVDVEIVPGDHNTVLREPYVQVLASRLNEILAETEARLSNNHPS